jgi:hypothetical protein
MDIPGWFAEELEAQSFGFYRVRWSAKRARFQVEEKIGRQAPRKARFDSLDDEAIREEQGYKLLFEVAPGDRTRCPRCDRWMQVTKMKVKTSRCPWCRKEWKFFYMPLGTDLLIHLRYIQPERGGYDRVLADTDRKNEWREKTRRRDRHNQTEAIWKEDFTQNFEIDSVGYGKHSGTRTWK